MADQGDETSSRCRDRGVRRGGLQGKVSKKPIGQFAYNKRTPDGEEWLILMAIYLLLIKDGLPIWPEARERQRCWLGQKDAAAQVDEGQLARLILELEG